MKITEIIGTGTTINAQTINIVIAPPPADAEKKQIVNPGIKYGSNHKAKWSPPLQHSIDIMKDATGPTAGNPTVEHGGYGGNRRPDRANSCGCVQQS